MRIFSILAKQTSWQILGKVVSSISTFIILGIIARKFGEEGTGIFTLALTYLSIFYLLSDFGFNAHELKKLQTLPSGGKVEWRKLLGTRIIWSSLLMVLAIITLPFWPFATAQFSQAVLYGSLAILASGIYVSCNLIFQSRLRYNLSVLASSIGILVGLGVFIYLVDLNLSVPHLLLAHLLGWVVNALCALIFIRKLLPTSLPIFDFGYTKKLFLDSWPIAATLALNVIYFRIDSFLLAYFRSVSEVGIYNIAFSIFQTALVFPAFVMNAYYPIMLKSLKQAKLVGFGFIIVSSLGTVLTLIFAPYFVSLLTGTGFTGSVQSLQILSLGFPAFFLSSLLMWLMVTKGNYKKMLLIYLIGLIFNLVANIIFIPKYSFIAASVITVISEYLILLLQIITLYWLRK